MIPGQLLLDTNIVSYLMKGNDLGKLYAPRLQGKLLTISFVTVGEMYYGAERAGWGERRRNQLENTLRNFVVVPYDHEIARSYGRLVAEEQRKGRIIAPNDAWIAACAVRHQIPIVTHNAKDFFGINSLEVITEKKED